MIRQRFYSIFCNIFIVLYQFIIVCYSKKGETVLIRNEIFNCINTMANYLEYSDDCYTYNLNGNNRRQSPN